LAIALVLVPPASPRIVLAWLILMFILLAGSAALVVHYFSTLPKFGILRIIGSVLVSAVLVSLFGWYVWPKPDSSHAATQIPSPTPVSQVTPTGTPTTTPSVTPTATPRPLAQPLIVTTAQPSAMPQPERSAPATPTPTTQTQAEGNSLMDFKITRETDREVDAEVWYFYTGDLGTEHTGVSITPYTQTGDKLPYISSFDGHVIAVKTKAIAKLRMNFYPPAPGVIETSSRVELCIVDHLRGPLYCRSFPYEKTWK
jgi:hypothetical protein